MINNIQNALPTTMIVISLLSGIVYAICGNWGKSLYWVCGGLLNYAVTYMMM